MRSARAVSLNGPPSPSGMTISPRRSTQMRSIAPRFLRSKSTEVDRRLDVGRIHAFESRVGEQQSEPDAGEAHEARPRLLRQRPGEG